MKGRRYRFLTQEDVYAALNKLRTAFLAAKDGEQVDEIIKGTLTYDERMKVGRRILIAQMLESGLTFREISQHLKVGINTVSSVAQQIEEYPKCFQLINKREFKVEKEFRDKAYRKVGGPKKFFKSKEYTGFTRKQVKR